MYIDNKKSLQIYLHCLYTNNTFTKTTEDMIKTIQPLRWQAVHKVRIASRIVPPRPGLYAYVEVQHVLGLPSTILWKYVGQARNLSRRLEQHERLDESNGALRRWLIGEPRSGQLWYALTDQDQLDLLERIIIRDGTPTFNSITYNGE